MWDDRYKRPDYLFGTEPAAFLTGQAPHIPPASNVLVIADGEGRNSVYLAQLGHTVTAFDGSPVAVEKARRLAEAREAVVDFRVADIFDWDWAATQFDAVVGIFFQFMGPEPRAQVFAGLDRALSPGGMLLIHGYAPRQVEYGTGGPPHVENMYTLPLLTGAFAGYEVIVAEDHDTMIDEGAGHSGTSGVIDFVARKPEQPG